MKLAEAKSERYSHSHDQERALYTNKKYFERIKKDKKIKEREVKILKERSKEYKDRFLRE